MQLVVLVKIDRKAAAEPVQAVRQILAGNMAGEVDRSDICDGFFVDTNGLSQWECHGQPILRQHLICGPRGVILLTLRRSSSSAFGEFRQLAIGAGAIFVCNRRPLRVLVGCALFNCAGFFFGCIKDCPSNQRSSR